MIRRLYVDNYRSLVDFTWTPGAETLVLGYNGSGKTTALDAIDVIRSWVTGTELLDDILTSQDVTRWMDSSLAQFELDLEVGESTYRYRVEFDCPKRGATPFATHESLVFNQNVLLERINEEVILYEGGQKSLTFPSPRHQSAVMNLGLLLASSPVTDFLGLLSRMVVVRPMPPLMRNEARSHGKTTGYDFEKFVDWYWGQSLSGSFQRAMLGLLDEVWNEFDFLRFDPIGREVNALSLVFKHPVAGHDKLVIEFHELSEGERMLVVLYSLMAYQKSTPVTTIIIDEPDNFVALSELQPWLLRMLDERPEGGQLILVSHNPEIMQTMGFEHAALFERADHYSPSRVRTVSPDETGLSLSERLRRGWLEARPVHE